MTRQSIEKMAVCLKKIAVRNLREERILARLPA
jgi:hypothetical protein